MLRDVAYVVCPKHLSQPQKTKAQLLFQAGAFHELMVEHSNEHIGTKNRLLQLRVPCDWPQSLGNDRKENR